MAKDLVRTKKYVTKFYTMRSRLQAVDLKLQTCKSTEAMMRAMKGVTAVRSPSPARCARRAQPLTCPAAPRRR